MSVHAISWVLRHSEAQYGARLVLIVLADHADAEGRGTYPSVGTIAREARLEKRQVQRVLMELAGSGRIARRPEASPFGTTIYDLCLNPEIPADVDARAGGGGRLSPPDTRAAEQDISDKSGAADVTQTVPSNRKEPERPLTYRGKRVPTADVAAARHLLTVFNEATGRNLNAESHLRQIAGALLTRPEVSTERWERAIRNTVANPPSFVDGDIQLGDIFGPKAADRALSNKGKAANRSGPEIPAAGMCRECSRRPRVTGSAYCGPCREGLEAKLTGGPVAA